MVISFLRELYRFSPFRIFLSCFLFILLGLTQGVGLVMIIPLLASLGFSPGQEKISSIHTVFTKIFSTIGLPIQLSSLLFVYVVIVIFFAFLERYQSLLNARIQQQFTHFWRTRLYRSLTYAQWIFMVRMRSSDITHALTADIQQIGSGTVVLFQFASAIVLIFFQVIVAFLLSPTLTALTLVFGGSMIFFVKPMNRQALDTGVSTRFSRQELYNTVSEHLTGMKTAKSFAAEAQHLQRMQTISQVMEQRSLEFSQARAHTRFYYEVGGVLFLSLFFAIAVYYFHTPSAHLLLLAFIFVRLLPKFSALHQQYQNIKNMLPAFAGTALLYQQAQEAVEPGIETPNQAIPFQQTITFANVYFKYAPHLPYAIDDVSFTIHAHQITAFVGPSGAGKSTLADLLLGLLKPEGGQILIDGQELTPAHLYYWRHAIAYVPQEAFLFHDTIRANLLWAQPNASEEQLWEALQQAAAQDFVRLLPLGLDTVVGDRGLCLSGGERQRLALARALLRYPQILILDEATSALDSENETRIQDAIQSLRGKLTIIIIAHRSATLNQADQLIYIEQGKIINP